MPNASPPIPEAKAREATQLERAAREAKARQAELEAARRDIELERRALFDADRAARELERAARQIPEDEVRFRKLAKLDEAARQAAEAEQRRYGTIRRDLTRCIAKPNWMLGNGRPRLRT